MKKKSLSFAAALFSMIAVLLSGCSDNLVGDATIKGEGIEGKRNLSIIITNYENGKAERTILPDALKLEDLNFKIEGKSSTGNVLASRDLNVETTGTAYVPLAPAVWDLTLTAYKQADPVLKGYANANLINGPQQIKFTLKPYDITTKGSVKLNCSYTYIDGSHGKVEAIIAALFDKNTGAMISGSEEKVTEINNSFAYEKDNLEPGSFMFKVFFLNKDCVNYASIDHDTDEMGFYGDLLVVDPGNETAKTVAIPDVIGVMPEAPSNFAAYLVDDSEDPDHYNVKFTWTSNSTNERYFEIEIKEYKDVSTVVTGDAWKVLNGENYKTAASDLYVSGNLLPVAKTQKGEFVYKLKTGKLYDATIKAVNKFGSKEAVNRITTGLATETDCTGFDETNSVRINRVAITYDLKGGILTTAVDTTTEGVIFEYKTYKDANISLKTIEKTASPVNYPTLVKNGIDFTRWVEISSSDESADAAVTETDTWKNISVKAIYESGITVEIPGYTDLNSERVTAVIEGTTNVKSGANEISGSKPVTITVAPPTDGQPEYEKYKVLVNGKEAVAATSNNVMTLNTESYEGGTYTVNVMALIKDGTQWFTDTFVIKISK